MNHLINWFEIPVTDFERAMEFYEKILGMEIQQAEMMGSRMGFFPSDGKNVSGALVQGNDYKPSTEGITLYLNGGDDLQLILEKVKNQKGKILVPKTQISPEMGYFAMFMDCEGNKMALHSMK